MGYYVNGSFYNPTLVEHWNGTSWSVVPSPNMGIRGNHLYGVAAVSANDVWAVGYYSPVGSSYDQTLVEHWNGSTWSVVPSPNVGMSHNYLYGVAAVSANDVWAVGYYYNDGTSTYQTLVEHWDGSVWSVVPSPNPGLNYYNVLDGVAAVSVNDLWAVGYHYNSSSTEQTMAEHYMSPCAPTSTPTPTSTRTYTPTPIPPCGVGSDYVFSQSFGETLEPGEALVPGSQCDDCVVAVPLPFAYNLYGLPYTNVNASSNGNLQFSSSSNLDFANRCLTSPTPPTLPFTNTIMPHWQDLDMSTNLTSSLGILGIYTSVMGTAPSRIFNIEWRACIYDSGSCGGDVNFEVRLYEGQDRFDMVYDVVADNGAGATVGVMRNTGSGQFGSVTQFSCRTNSLQPGLQIVFSPRLCPTNTPTPTYTPTFTDTPTQTPTATITPTSTPGPALIVGHVTWQGSPAQPHARQALPITMTLRLQSGGPAYEYTGLSTNPSGVFTVPADLPDGLYKWRVKGPDGVIKTLATDPPGFLSMSSTLTNPLTLVRGTAANVEMGVMRAGDANNDDKVNAIDFTIMKSTFGKDPTQPGYDRRADFNGDNVVNAPDFTLLKANFGHAGATPIGPPGP